jgi:hypothetical protein
VSADTGTPDDEIVAVARDGVLIEHNDTPITEWTDGEGDVWQEHPVDPTLVRIIRGTAGRAVTASIYQPRTRVEANFGGLTRLDPAVTPPRKPFTAVTWEGLGGRVDHGTAGHFGWSALADLEYALHERTGRHLDECRILVSAAASGRAPVRVEVTWSRRNTQVYVCTISEVVIGNTEVYFQMHYWGGGVRVALDERVTSVTIPR